ncbi:Protein-glutamate O-methyltransferase [Saliniradius amylolyticus]|uniref:Protein-glutamate O-methyltransferase n=1 Tax=Saliniradius amylolyticus TaxID=2183582 RepID=A0A2S2E3W9_9ALTE|nr:EAL domain-containing protein [Saliniradius amylolyticus]AWL12333.1 Protein-glutamate O-methyltransferase [Saliniradius amylolyticus]
MAAVERVTPEKLAPQEPSGGLCSNCSCEDALDFEIAMAFQPIVDVERREIFSHEALVRGINGEGAGEVFSKVNQDNLYSFDQACRVTAIREASKLDKDARISINFLPNAVYEPEACLKQTLRAARESGYPRDNITFEVTEHEKVNSTKIVEIFKTYQQRGFLTAIDDFGEGYAGLNLLAQFQPDILKLDMLLTRDIHKDKVKQAILRGIKMTADALDIMVVAEGVETKEEYFFLKFNGVRYMQGYYLCKPQFMRMAAPEDINWE